MTMKPCSPVCEKLVRRLRALGLNLPAGNVGYCIQRTRAGRHGLAAGTWSWYLYPITGQSNVPDQSFHPGIGSQHKLTDLLRAPGLSVAMPHHKQGSGIDIDPADTAEDTLFCQFGRPEKVIPRSLPRTK